MLTGTTWRQSLKGAITTSCELTVRVDPRYHYHLESLNLCFDFQELIFFGKAYPSNQKLFVKFISEQHSFRRLLNHFRLCDEEFPKNFQLKLSSSAKNYGFSIFSLV